MIKIIYNLTQPVAVISFLIAGICCFIMGNKYKAVVNIMFSLANFVVFYGDKFLK